MRYLLWVLIYFCFLPLALAQDDEVGIGETIQISTHLHSFVGKPSWLLIIRDVDTGNVYPYLYDIRRGDNYWVANTFSEHYLITVSQMQMVTFRSRTDNYRNYKIDNFCFLESNGRIIRNQSLSIVITGDLSPNENTYICNASYYR